MSGAFTVGEHIDLDISFIEINWIVHNDFGIAVRESYVVSTSTGETVECDDLLKALVDSSYDIGCPLAKNCARRIDILTTTLR
jgi:hypothetical protein